MKKWYQSHLDQLKAAQKKADEGVQKTSGNSFEAKKLRDLNRSRPSPVAASKLQRSKTDSR